MLVIHVKKVVGLSRVMFMPPRKIKSEGIDDTFPVGFYLIYLFTFFYKLFTFAEGHW